MPADQNIFLFWFVVQALILACRHNLPRAVEALLAVPGAIDAKHANVCSQACGTALDAAVFAHQHNATVYEDGARKATLDGAHASGRLDPTATGARSLTLLIESGLVDTRMQLRSGSTLLVWAAGQGFGHLVRLLVPHTGAGTNGLGVATATTTQLQLALGVAFDGLVAQFGEQRGAFDEASSSTYADIIRLLVASGQVNLDAQTTTRRLLTSTTPVRTTCLVCAAQHGYAGLARNLLDAGANPEAPDGQGLSALRAVLAQIKVQIRVQNARVRNTNGHDEVMQQQQAIVAMFLECGLAQDLPELVAFVVWVLQEGSTTPYHTIAESNGLPALDIPGIVARLSALGADWNHEDATGRTALMHACENVDTRGTTIVASALLAVVDVNWSSPRCGTALMFAAKRNIVQGVLMLVQAGADVNLVADIGGSTWTPLMCAAHNGYTEVVGALLAVGSDPNFGSDGEGRVHPNEGLVRGTTALMLAARNGHAATVGSLINHPATRVWQANAAGETALITACVGGCHSDGCRHVAMADHDSRAQPLLGWDNCNHAEGAEAYSDVTGLLVEHPAFDPNLQPAAADWQCRGCSWCWSCGASHTRLHLPAAALAVTVHAQNTNVLPAILDISSDEDIDEALAASAGTMTNFKWRLRSLVSAKRASMMPLPPLIEDLCARTRSEAVTSQLNELLLACGPERARRIGSVGTMILHEAGFCLHGPAGPNSFGEHLANDRQPVRLNVSLDDIVGSALAALYTQQHVRDGFAGRYISVRYAGNAGIDAGGLSRDFITRLAEALCQHELGLIDSCSVNGVEYFTPRPASNQDADIQLDGGGAPAKKRRVDAEQTETHRAKLRWLIGVVLGWSAVFRIPIPITPSPAMCRHLLSMDVSPVDLAYLELVPPYTMLAGIAALPEAADRQVQLDQIAEFLDKPLAFETDSRASQVAVLTGKSGVFRGRENSALDDGSDGEAGEAGKGTDCESAVRQVTPSCIEEFIHKLATKRLKTNIEREMADITQGFDCVVGLRPPDRGALKQWWAKHQICDEASCHLRKIIAGTADFDVAAWKSFTDVEGGTVDSRAVQLFWEYIQGLDQAKRAKLFYWITGIRRLPVGGFSALQNRLGISLLRGRTDALPVAHTCAFSIELPFYTSAELLAQKFNQAVFEYDATEFQIL